MWGSEYARYSPGDLSFNKVCRRLRLFLAVIYAGHQMAMYVCMKTYCLRFRFLIEKVKHRD